MNYSRYQAARQPQRPTFRKALLLLVVVLLVAAGGITYTLHHKSKSTGSPNQSTAATQKTSAAITQKNASQPNQCATSTETQSIIVSISKRHMWACSATTSQYDSAVVTGMENLPADLTPTGTYHIYAKATDLHLRGSDSTGSWDDPVSYWMPFLDNQYGTYGFHDATWRATSDFGNISPYSSNASHGCVELPLAAAKWLYNWAPVGTTVTIES